MVVLPASGNEVKATPAHRSGAISWTIMGGGRPNGPPGFGVVALKPDGGFLALVLGVRRNFPRGNQCLQAGTLDEEIQELPVAQDLLQ